MKTYGYAGMRVISMSKPARVIFQSFSMELQWTSISLASVEVNLDSPDLRLPQS